MKRILLDTNAWLWFALRSERLSPAARELLGDAEAQIFLSAASIWEVVIKHGSNRLALPLPPSEFVAEFGQDAGFDPLPIAPAHTLAVAQLPPIHRDPFDRILVAQAQVEGLVLLTSDATIPRYSVPTFPAGG